MFVFWFLYYFVLFLFFIVIFGLCNYGYYFFIIVCNVFFYVYSQINLLGYNFFTKLFYVLVLKYYKELYAWYICYEYIISFEMVCVFVIYVVLYILLLLICYQILWIKGWSVFYILTWRSNRMFLVLLGIMAFLNWLAWLYAKHGNYLYYLFRPYFWIILDFSVYNRMDIYCMLFFCIVLLLFLLYIVWRLYFFVNK